MEPLLRARRTPSISAPRAQELQDDEPDDRGNDAQRYYGHRSDLGRHRHSEWSRRIPSAAEVVIAAQTDQKAEHQQRLVRADDPQRFLKDRDDTHGLPP
jgi:hypothetical protein